MNILCIGDIVGKPGRQAIEGVLGNIRKEYDIDFVIANGENSAGGSGLTSRMSRFLWKMGCDVITLGDHVWDQKELEGFLDKTDRVIRPANFPEGAPGKGWGIYQCSGGLKVGVINLLGRVFMRYHVNCPFRELQKIVDQIRKETSVIVVDFHAETTSEKVALGYFANGKVSAVFGTHTHIPTADERILSEGTAYITDVGMTGPYDSVIGQNKENIIARFLTSMPKKFSVAVGEISVNGIIVKIDEKTGKALTISRLRKEWVENKKQKD
ncbi:MAG: TIGR00282 family metallophosphoesterase [Candidatus Omnitrophica bacterium]|nr:TIGR00282 family metallophosphoesterase [Candidatus Omnitrophota bacterium]MCB9747117.1 TIGR00282 family metallophosphoesterase [Candidatus Omnitrophota bacterium]